MNQSTHCDDMSILNPKIDTFLGYVDSIDINKHQ